MRSPADRSGLERGLRAAAFALLAFAAWARLAPDARPGRAALTADPGALAAWTRRPAAESLAVAVAGAPGPAVTAWLGALRRAGDAVTWSGGPPAVALAAEPRPDPAGGARVAVAAAPGAVVVLSDGLGPLDSATASGGGAWFAVPARTGALRVAAGGARAVVASADSALVRRVAVLGGAGWESRFVIAALEERGWAVDARLRVAPGIAVTQGRALPPDTATHAAVVLLDSLAGAEAAAVTRFVAAGGGLVLGPGAAAGALAALAPAREGVREAAPLRVAGAASPAMLARRPLVPRADAVVLERLAGDAVVAARRAGAGRVVQVGYEETWRWRLAGDAGAVDGHRDWWTDVVVAAARPAVLPAIPAAEDDPAPRAALEAALGPPREPSPAAARARDPRGSAGLLALLGFGCLLAEWMSRRLRGAA